MVVRTPKGPRKGQIHIPGRITAGLKNIIKPVQNPTTLMNLDAFTTGKQSHPDVRFGVAPIGDFGSRIPHFLAKTNICHIRWDEIPDAREETQRHHQILSAKKVQATNLLAILRGSQNANKRDVPTFLTLSHDVEVNGRLFNALVHAARLQRWNAPIFLMYNIGEVAGFWHPTAASGEKPALIVDIGANERATIPSLFEQMATGEPLNHLRDTPILIRLHGNLSRLSVAKRGQLAEVIHKGLSLLRDTNFQYVGVGTPDRAFIAELHQREIRLEDSYRSAAHYKPILLTTKFRMSSSLILQGAMPLRSLSNEPFSPYQPTATSIGQIPTSEQYLMRRDITPDRYQNGTPVIGTDTYSAIGAINGLLMGQPQTLLIGSFGALLTLQMTSTDCIYGTDITTSIPILGDIVEPLLTGTANREIVSILKRFPLFFTLNVNPGDITRRFQAWAERLVGHFTESEFDRVVVRTQSREVIAASDSLPNETDYFVRHGDPIIPPSNASTVTVDMTRTDVSKWDALEVAPPESLYVQDATSGQTALLYHVHQDKIRGVDINADTIDSTRLIEILFHFMSRHEMVERRGRMVRGKLLPLPYPIRVTFGTPRIPEVLRDQFENWDTALTKNDGPGITIITPARQFVLGHNSHRMDQAVEFGRFSAYQSEDSLFFDTRLIGMAAQRISPYRLNSLQSAHPPIRELRGFGTIHPDAQGSIIPEAYTYAALHEIFIKYGLDEYGDLELLAHYINGGLFPEFTSENFLTLRISFFQEAMIYPERAPVKPPLGFLFLASSPKHYLRIEPGLLRRVYERQLARISDPDSEYNRLFRFAVHKRPGDSVIVFSNPKAPEEAERLLRVASTLQQSLKLDQISDRLIDSALEASED